MRSGPRGVPFAGLSAVARKKTPKTRVNVKASLSRRLREVRQELFGEHGGPELSRRLGLPARTWYNYETGVTVPAEVLLEFIEQTGVNPSWLLGGEGPRYKHASSNIDFLDFSPVELIRRGLERLEHFPQDVRLIAPEDVPATALSEFTAVKVVPLQDLGRKGGDSGRNGEHIMAFRQWLPHPDETVGVRLSDDTMWPILPAGSVVAIDRSVTDPLALQGKLVAAIPPDREPVIRWLDVSGRHMILRPNQLSREHPLLPIELNAQAKEIILGQVVWAWSWFGH